MTAESISKEFLRILFSFHARPKVAQIFWCSIHPVCSCLQVSIRLFPGVSTKSMSSISFRIALYFFQVSLSILLFDCSKLSHSEPKV